MKALRRSYSLPFQIVLSSAQVISQAITPGPVFPVNGPAGFHHLSASRRPSKITTVVINKPMTKVPIAPEIMAAAAGPVVTAVSAISRLPPLLKLKRIHLCRPDSGSWAQRGGSAYLDNKAVDLRCCLSSRIEERPRRT
jgi:hypothetical protein